MADAGNSTAACFSTWQGRLGQTEDGGISIRRNLIDPISADVLLAVGHRTEDGCSTSQRCGIHEKLKGLQPLTHVRLYRMPTVLELTAQMERLPHWGAVVRAFQTVKVNCTRRDTRRDGASSTPYKCTGIYKSNTIFSPVLGTTFNLQELLGLRQCLHAIVAAETTLRGGRTYDRIVHSRIEFRWLYPHPPLMLLDPAYVWLPSGEDYGGGFNDRHAVLSRRAATAYFGTRWDAILSGEVMEIDPQLRAGAVLNSPALQGDHYVRTVLMHAKLPVRRFASVAALRCCQGPCFTHSCYTRVLPRPEGMRRLLRDLGEEASTTPRGATRSASVGSTSPKPSETPLLTSPLMTTAVELTHTAFSSRDGGGGRAMAADVVAGKYRDELENALQHTLALTLPGSHYALEADPKQRRAIDAWNRRFPDRQKPMPLAVVVASPLRHAAVLAPTLLALRIAGRSAECSCSANLSMLGRKRRRVYESQYVAWQLERVNHT